MDNLFKQILIISTFFYLASCSGAKMFPSVKDQPTNAQERVEKNLKEGRGLKIGSALSKRDGGDFLFASSNPLWRATLEKLDFIPLANIDYAGGVIITDWYGGSGNSEELKVAVRFLTNEIRVDALDISVFKRVCDKTNSCQTSKIESNLSEEIKTSILKRATVLSKETESKKNE